MSEGTTERRFNEGSGQRYLQNGKIRCQACAKHKIKAIRIREGDPTLESADCWPEAQCNLAAAPGGYTCAKWHGGGAQPVQLTVAGTTLFGEYMPAKLAVKFQKFVNQGQLLNNYEDIASLQARQAELLERLDQMVVGPEGWQAVADAVDAIREGEYPLSIQLLKMALADESAENKTQAEIRENMKLLDQLRRTNLHIEEKQGSMILRDEYLGTLDMLFKAVEALFKKKLPEGEANAAIAEFAEAVIQLTNAGPFVNRRTVTGQIVDYGD